MDIFITGAPGWLGNKTVDYFTRKHNVTALVLPYMDARHLEKMGAKIVRGDITKPETLRGVMDNSDYVLHIAGIIHPPFSKLNLVYKINTEGTKNMLKAAIDSDVKRFVYISSNSAQGIQRYRDELLKEDMPCRPYMAYGKSKKLAEEAVMRAHHDGLETVILRPCWFYGPGQPARQTKLIKMIKEGKVPLFGDGQNLRSMSYLDNTIQGMELALTKKKANGNIYWITDEKPYTTIEIYETIADILGVPLRVRKIPGFFADIAEIMDKVIQALGFYEINIHVAGEMNKNIACSIEKAKKELGYKPRISLRKGMEISIDWARQHGQL